MDQDYLAFFDNISKYKQKERENRAKLEVMSYLREISGRKYDKPVSLADWDDKSNLEQEIVDQMRHIGFKPWTEIAGPVLLEEPLNSQQGLPVLKNSIELSTNYFKPYNKKNILPGYESFDRLGNLISK
ncbi:uncharacterized protein LOC123037807 [Drosophila rhopaloa]|uniref:Uncharacterized protein n=1 Tax=Drosophila rhopaloa TaxID=1041015 RepID=A0ABM5JBQ8_DRORH|nr:uncharacterized protein LOC123037807 [Drosophila rhopaloa]